MSDDLIWKTLRAKSKASPEDQQIFIKFLEAQPLTSDQLQQYMTAALLVLEEKTSFRERIESIIDKRQDQYFKNIISDQPTINYKQQKFKNNNQLSVKEALANCRTSKQPNNQNFTIFQRFAKLFFSSKNQKEPTSKFKEEKQHKENEERISLKYDQDEETTMKIVLNPIPTLNQNE